MDKIIYIAPIIQRSNIISVIILHQRSPTFIRFSCIIAAHTDGDIQIPYRTPAQRLKVVSVNVHHLPTPPNNNWLP